MENILNLILSGDIETGLLLVKDCITKYKPLVYGLGKEALDILNDLANNKEFAKVQATMKKNMYDAYIEAGFSEEQAFALIINDNLKLLKQMEKLQQNK